MSSTPYLDAKPYVPASLSESKGRTLSFEIEDVFRDARRSRVKAKLPDDDGAVTGD